MKRRDVIRIQPKEGSMVPGGEIDLLSVVVSDGPAGFVLVSEGSIGPDGAFPDGSDNGFLAILQEFGMEAGLVRIWFRDPIRVIALTYRFAGGGAARFFDWAASIPSMAAHVEARESRVAGAISCVEPGGCFVALLSSPLVSWVQADRCEDVGVAVGLAEGLAVEQASRLLQL